MRIQKDRACLMSQPRFSRRTSGLGEARGKTLDDCGSGAACDCRSPRLGEALIQPLPGVDLRREPADDVAEPAGCGDANNALGGGVAAAAERPADSTAFWHA